MIQKSNLQITLAAKSKQDQDPVVVARRRSSGFF